MLVSAWAGARSRVPEAEAQPEVPVGVSRCSAGRGVGKSHEAAGRSTREPGNGSAGLGQASGVSAEVEVRMEEVLASPRLTVIKIRDCKSGLGFTSAKTAPCLLCDLTRVSFPPSSPSLTH